MDELKLNEELVLGVASSATQIEGSDKRNSWYDWYKKGYIKDGSSPLRANDHYNLYKEDIDLMAQMGIKYYRLGIEWSRIEPTRGVFNNGEIKHYRDLLTYMLDSGITPLLTLHHFTNPMWFENMGGFENDACVEIFLHYVKKITESLGDLVSEYITVNEPNVYAVNGYFFGAWPPGKQNIKLMSKVLTNMAKCHISAYNLIHDIRKQMGYDDTKVSYAVHMRVFEPKDEKSVYQRFASKKLEQYFQTAIVKAMTLGECVKPIKKLGVAKGLYSDFIALNYYTRSTVTGFEDGVKENSPVNDLGWEIYPEGLEICAKKLYDIAPMPIYVTENGTCDNTDDFRIKYIYEHLKVISKSELPFKRYYHWCFTDNFEWLEGESAKFGLVKVDYSTQERTIKKSGEFYSEVIKKHGITEEMALKYTGQYYKRSDGSVIDGIDDVYFDYGKTLKSEIGSGVVTNVSKYAENPAEYNENDEREKKGIAVNKELQKAHLENATSGALVGALNKPESCETDVDTLVDEIQEDMCASVTKECNLSGKATSDNTENTVVEEEYNIYENDYDSLIEEYEIARAEVEEDDEKDESFATSPVEETPDLLDRILERVKSDENEECKEAINNDVVSEIITDTQSELKVCEDDYDSLIDEYRQAECEVNKEDERSQGQCECADNNTIAVDAPIEVEIDACAEKISSQIFEEADAQETDSVAISEVEEVSDDLLSEEKSQDDGIVDNSELFIEGAADVNEFITTDDSIEVADSVVEEETELDDDDYIGMFLG